MVQVKEENMAQYSYYTKEIPKYWTDPDTGLRTRIWIHNDYVQIDCELVANGFSLAENVGWMTVESYGEEVTGSRAREGVISGQYYFQVEKTPTGFAGAEDTDYITVEGGL